MTEHKDVELGQCQIARLTKYAIKGSLPECYTGVDDWLHDFYPDFSWNKNILVEIDYVLTHPSFHLVKKFFTDRYQFDIENELNKAKELRK